MIERAIEFWRQHIILANLSHASGGFGLGVVLQQRRAFSAGSGRLDSARVLSGNASVRLE